MSHELYKIYRPSRLEDLIGQDAAVAALKQMIQRKAVPHAILASGPSGCGKTTIGRILKEILNCGNMDWQEINAADFKGIDTIRDIRSRASMAPIDGDCRIWFIDESHKLSGDAQQAFLKLLEDTPKHVYFILATTEPAKLIKAIHTRCTEIKLLPLPVKDLEEIVIEVAGEERIKLHKGISTSIAEAAEGSARKALVLLEQIVGLSPDEQMEIIERADAIKSEAIQLARELIKPRPSWSAIAKILKELTDDPESVRYLVLGYARTVLLGGGPLAPVAFKLIDIFAKNFYDSKAAGLAAACWEVVHN